MKRAVLVALAALPLISVVACKKETATPPSGPAQAGVPPPPPPYQMRPEAPAGDRLAAGRDGKALFEYHCGYCHLVGGMGTNLLTKQQVMAGASPEMGLLANRTDLTADYVTAVVRLGKNAMPPQTRVDITDPELDSVSAYLGKGK
ncbi:Cytochrome C oxidase, cbb3-type, subunit III [Novosphingobium sp. CF614]|uniref:c-type cytochrome n=1 Tax=Novosphingobium sp. CF614 TaxID=1884364 RepID=UPI0008EA803A|nr:cytochrome c [Novosphingobium sp. CF614]SFG44561.1 Cytochrome C oxidase, cbb3-type, subunit III [Novosphingobium sp. CF614]